MAELPETMEGSIFDKVIFDVDSTLVKIEGLDHLARKKGVIDKCEGLTSASMNGDLDFNKVMVSKMDLIKPSLSDLYELGEHYVNSLVKDANNTIEKLISLNKGVYIVTGNFYPAVEILAEYLKIPKQNVFANTIFFDDMGNYVGFDREGKLSNNNGKLEVIKKYLGKGKRVFIGDGITDLEAKEAVDLFIGYGGVTLRDNVEKGSDIYIKQESLQEILPYVLTKEELLKVNNKL